VPNFNYPDVNLKLLGIDEEKYYKEKEEYEKKAVSTKETRSLL